MTQKDRLFVIGVAILATNPTPLARAALIACGCVLVLLDLVGRRDVPGEHLWQEYNAHGNTCHHPGCPLTEEEHAKDRT